MKSNLDVCTLFVDSNKEKAESSNMYFVEDKIYTYGTILAQKFKDENGEDSIIVNETKYSTSSSKHLKYLKSALGKCKNEKLNIYIIKDRVPKGTESLDIHIINIDKLININKIIKI